MLRSIGKHLRIRGVSPEEAVARRPWPRSHLGRKHLEIYHEMVLCQEA